MWKTVPTEPTAEMLSAGRNAPKESILIGDSCVMRPDKDAVLMSNLSSIWQAMVVVSPAYSSAGIACELALLAQTLEYSDGARTTIAIGSAEIEQLRAELGLVIREAHENKQRARNFERDTNRYRWLRDGKNDTEALRQFVAGEELDAAIDAAMAGGMAVG